MKLHIKENQQESIEGMSMEYPYAYHYVNLQETKVPWHWHEELEMEYVVCGRLKVSTAGKTYYFEEGQGFFMNSNILSAMEDGKGSRSCILESHLFHPVFLGGHFKSVFETKYLNPVLLNKKIEVVELLGKSQGEKQILKKLRRLSALQSQEDMEFQTRNLLSDIWLLLLDEMKDREFDQPEINPVSQERIQTMLSFVHQNYNTKLTLEEIADSAAISKRECLRCFRECLDKTPFQYLLDYRIEMAEKLLRTTDIPVTEIAMNTGFSSAAYFGKVFKEISGKTPGMFRRSSSGKRGRAI